MNQFTASLWGDEAWAAILAAKPYFQIVQIVARDTSPPLYYLLLHTWMQIFGTSEVAIRFLSFLFFIGTVLTVYLIGQHLWDKKTGLLASLLTFTNPFLFQYAFEGRMYTLLALTSTLSVYFFLKKQKVAFVSATLTALYTHHFAIFIVAFEGFWALVENWQKGKKEIFKNISGFFIIGLGYLPWVYPLYYQTSLVGSGFWLATPSWMDLKNLILKFLAGPGETILEKVALWSIWAVLVLRLWRKDWQKSASLLGWFFTPLFLTFFISQYFQSIFFDRYMLMSIPAVCVLLASLRRKISLIPLAVIIISLGVYNLNYFFSPTKRPFRQLADFVKKEAGDMTLVNYSATAHHLFESKYYGIPAPIYAPNPLPFYVGTALMEEGDTIKTLPEDKEILVISSDNPQKVALSNFKLEKSKKFDNLYLLWFARLY